MSSRVTRDHHSLTRNLKLNGNYISNDGGDEGITVSDTGEIELTPSQVTIDRNSTLTVTSQPTGLKIDFDQTGICASGQNIDAVGLDIDMNCDSVTSVGFMDQVGIDIDLVSEDAGSINRNEGIRVNTSGADINSGILITTPDVDTGNDIQIYSSASSNDHFTIKTKGNGETLLKTYDGGGSVGHLTLEADGNCTVESAVGNFRLHDGNDIVFEFDLADPTLKIMDDADKSDYFSINVGASGATTITTVDAGAAIANLDFVIDGEIDFNASTCGFTAQTGTDAVSIDWGLGNKYHLLMENNSTVTFATNPVKPCNLLLKVAQGNGGSKIITWAVTSGTIYWAGGGILNTDEPTLTTTDDKTDILSFYFDGTNYFGVASLNFDTT